MLLLSSSLARERERNVGGIPATVADAAPAEVAGLMQIVIQIPQGVQPGGYVPVVLQVGDNPTTDGAARIAAASD